MSEQLFQIGVKAVIQNKKNEILLLHAPKWAHHAEHWDLPGGRMSPGETIAETLNRELQEELGTTYVNEPIQLTTFQTSFTIPVGSKYIPLILIVYKVDLDPSREIKLSKDLNEDKLQWFTRNRAIELLKYKFTENVSELLSKL